ncbi:hypothetical protein CROQUDRAFT_665549 [Cronartium quercuum f. sp. fusiforme G11]|uniref:Acyl-protein thioesterase 1 n=1 Tax=Cronartium quercuum f. sp. fusiforme G11 TaxID=708437 RepID=A0A9P6T5R7_9BASI|nr:hypothetical protein CROQUDRAFT_665549 [Cronartium quercuum f. sp. fusiforme G11]
MGCSCQLIGASPLLEQGCCSCVLPAFHRLPDLPHYRLHFLQIFGLLFTIIVVYLAVHFSDLHYFKKNLSSSSHGFIPPAAFPTQIPTGGLGLIAPAKESLEPLLYRRNWTSSNDGISPLDYDVIEPLSPGVGKGKGWTVVFIHGLGALNASHGWQWRDFLLSKHSISNTQSQIGKLDGLRFIFPKAPIRPITVFDGSENHGSRPGWFDVKDWRDLNFLEDEEGLRESCIGIAMILSEQIRLGLMKMEWTIIAGFSQGAVMALILTLVLARGPSATLMLSAYLPLPFRLPMLNAVDEKAYNETSLYWLHGVQDEVLTYNSAKGGFKLLEMLFGQKFKRMKFKSFPNLTHSFNIEEVLVVTNWIELMVDRKSEGEFDQEFDQVLVPENELDDFRGNKY